MPNKAVSRELVVQDLPMPWQKVDGGHAESRPRREESICRHWL
jgi:hypothetical protein